MEQQMNKNKSEMIIYQTDDGKISIDVRMDGETMWLSQAQIAELFGKERSVITKHIKNILTEEELDNSVCANFAHTASDGKVYETQCYNLDMILSVGYRVNSKQGVRFRKWASGVLRDYLINGYSINKDKMIEGKIKELQSAIDLISNTLINSSSVTEVGEGFIEIIKAYSKTWDLLIKYDEDRLLLPQSIHETPKEIISYEYAINSIKAFKTEIGSGGLFGIERDGAFKGILGNIMQSFGGQDLYPSTEEKAAHLLYFVIKDHPFSDGNKRIGSFLFLLYLKISSIDLSKINENTITALALLVAESKSSQKDMMVKLIMHLIH